MKRQIRRSVFETNSSSVHSLTMCQKSEFDDWQNGKTLFWGMRNRFITKENAIAELKQQTNFNGTPQYAQIDWNDPDDIEKVFAEECIQTFDQFFNGEYETMTKDYTTKGGESVVAFGYFGYD